MLKVLLKGEKILNKKAKPVEKITPGVKKLIREMKKIMLEANGVGLAANQVGSDLALFVAFVDNKFYAVINPKITEASREKVDIEEGCLSIPDTCGVVKRPAEITLEGMNIYGKKIKIKAWGLLARVFQHEVDHLSGILFDKKAKDLHKIEEVQKQ